ncbi:hypothetical protein Xbed_01605 [Xenorhabdus beddingii]|uniref:Uncharacterized protein n=1 Tax=Xenorhabdus beddingii TaxID=40578 RepID=A0A1Y2SNE5_9GAMM|nr:hypothetical protein [Xenorhabdus beddingii]OTA20379.1 hypothetical protein Xbed_01605 [Xenorhabdus beddingii]
MGMVILPVGVLLLVSVLACLIAFIATCWIYLQKGQAVNSFFIIVSGGGLALSSYGLYKLLSIIGMI